MGKSRTGISRTKIRHHKRLQEQRLREQRREQKKYVPEGFSFKQYKMELLLVILMACAVCGILFLGPDKKAMNLVRDSYSFLIEGKEEDWEAAYPYGYKIIALTDKGIVHTSYDTLPGDLKIDWKKVSVVRIQMKEFGSLEEKINIEIPEISYLQAGVSGMTIKVAFIRKEGAGADLAKLGAFKFTAEIIKDTEGLVFCLFGLKDG